MINFYDFIKEETKEHNPNWLEILDHPCRILIIGGFETRKTNLLFDLINQQSDIDKIYLYAKDISEAKYQFLIKKCEEVETKHFNIQILLFNIQTLWLIFIKTLKIIIQIKNKKH